ncbi:PPM-type phosphatase domain-containing protein [Aphelenchoides fujianensis]|nr:PPM-type phosphatase domain-containing protein [Aphelenchoides fujianensis]
MIFKKTASSTTRRCFSTQHSRLARTKTNADAILRANERTLFLEDHAIQRVDVCQLAANRPIEDFYSAAKCLSSNAHLFELEEAKASRTSDGALQSAFLALDTDISNGALPDSHGRVCRMSANVAASGSCALMAHVRRQHLHVANAGDSQAVLCVNNHGNLMARQLSFLHNSENLDEVSRVRGEHPISESTSVIRGDRLLGELIPLRSIR